MTVTDDKRALTWLNELEMVPAEELSNKEAVNSAEVMLNVLGKNLLYRVDVASGRVLKKYNLQELMNRQMRLVKQKKVSNYDRANNVLNGIAYNSHRKSWFVTGKRWYQIYEIQLH